MKLLVLPPQMINFEPYARKINIFCIACTLKYHNNKINMIGESGDKSIDRLLLQILGASTAKRIEM